MNVQDLTSLWGSPQLAAVASRASAHLPFWVSLGLTLVIGYELARVAVLLYPAAPVAWTAPPVMPRGTQTVGGPDAGAIAAAHLFGEAGAEPAPPPEGALVDAPDTRLNLQLRGVVAAGEKRMAHAIIADASNEEHVYFVSDAVPGGASLHQVYPDRVILNRGGNLEVLRLPRDYAPSPARSGRRIAPRSAAPAPSIQQAVMENAASFMDIVRPQPFMPEGQLKGYRVYPGPNRQRFAALGLRPGDLVTEINGMPLNNPAQGMEIFRSLGDATQVTVTLERDGQPTVLSLDMTQIDELGGAEE